MFTFPVNTFFENIISSIGSAVWNASDKGANVTLTNNNLTASINGSSGILVRATLGKSSGKWYWEIKASTAALVGVSKSTQPFDNFTGETSNSWGYHGVNGAKYNGGGGLAYGEATYTNTDTIGIALDMDDLTITFYKNGVSLGVAFSNLNGTVFPASSNNAVNGVTVIANFGQSAFIYTPPAGHSSLI